MTTFTIHKIAGAPPWVTPSGGNTEKNTQQIISWNTSSRVAFTISLKNFSSDTDLAWSDVFSTPQPAFPVVECEGKISRSPAAKYVKYAVTMVDDPDNSLDPIIIIGDLALGGGPVGYVGDSGQGNGMSKWLMVGLALVAGVLIGWLAP